MGATRPHWWKVNIVSVAGMVPSGITTSPKSLLTKFCFAIWHLLTITDNVQLVNFYIFLIINIYDVECTNKSACFAIKYCGIQDEQHHHAALQPLMK